MKFGVVMDPIGTINFKKDSSLDIMIEAQNRGHDLSYIEPSSLHINESGAHALMHGINVFDNADKWFELDEPSAKKLSDLDVIIMRQDPPFDSDYIYNTYVLEAAEKEGVKVINRPRSLRDCNEKVFATEFPQCCTPFLVASNRTLLRDFINTHKDTVIKPLDGMGGSSIFRLREEDPNIAVVLETITSFYKSKVMIQRYIPEIVEGDKRILMINGEPMGAAIARVPAKGELRGNLAAGATAIAKSLTERDLWICSQVGPKLKELGLVLVGLDVIGDYLTEINVTSPTCFKEYKSLCDIEVSRKLMDYIENIANEG
jgi:glutathione synthase